MNDEQPLQQPEVEDIATRLRKQPKCIDLKKRFGKKYRVVKEESHAAEYGPSARIHDPWLLVIACRYGHIAPYQGMDMLQVSVDAGRVGVAGKLRRCPFVFPLQDGDNGEFTGIFPVDVFDEVAEIIRPRRRRQMTEEQLQVARERGKALFEKYLARKKEPAGA